MGSKSTPLGEEIQQKELLTVKEVADFLRVGRVTVWRWCKEGTIPACRVGRSWRIPRDYLLGLLENSLSSDDSVPSYSTNFDHNHRGQSTNPVDEESH